jgi:hypothetical protein
MKLSIGLAVFVLSAGLGVSAANATAIIDNGDFSQGNTGFMSQYTYVAPVQYALYPEGDYTVGSNSNALNPYWISVPAGNAQLLVNGATASTPTIWEEDNRSTLSGQSYAVSFQTTNLCCVASFTNANDPSLLDFQVSSDGGLTFSTLAQIYTGGPGVVETLNGAFRATGPTSFRIVDELGGSSGNDFAIDNISVSAVPEPSAWLLMLAGFAGVGLALRQARRRSTDRYRLRHTSVPEIA